MTGRSEQPTPGGSREPRSTDPFGAVLPDQTRDEDGTGWGDEEYDADDDLRTEVPPHHR